MIDGFDDQLSAREPLAIAEHIYKAHEYLDALIGLAIIAGVSDDKLADAAHYRDVLARAHNVYGIDPTRAWDVVDAAVDCVEHEVSKLGFYVASHDGASDTLCLYESHR